MNPQCDRCGIPFSSPLLPTPTQTTEVLQLLRTNSTPSDPFEMDAVIASCSADVVGYDTEIGRLKQTLSRLVSERNTLQRHVDTCRSVFAPVRRLPPEILAKIFALCASPPLLWCDETQSIPTAGSASFGQSHLMRLLRVCSAWHTIVTTTPFLWADLEVDLDALLFTPGRMVDTLSRLLDRSGQCSMVLHLTASIGRFNNSLELLGRCATRWRIADLHLSNEACLQLSRVTGRNFPCLESLAIGGTDVAGRDIFETAPNLRRVIISAVDGALPKLPWSQLHELTYYAFQPRVLRPDVLANRLAIMALCSNECEVNIYSLNLSFFDSSTFSAIRLAVESHIPIFRLAILDRNGEEHSREALGEIITALTLPNLQELHFRSSRPEAHPLFWPRDHFPAFASRSCFRDILTKLFLYDMVIAEDELVECLSDMRALMELFIQDVVGSSDHEENILINDTLLRRLTWRSDSSCIAPNLNIFSFASLFFFDDDALVPFVESRARPAERHDSSPFRMEAFALVDSELNIRVIGHGFGVDAIAHMDTLQKQGVLRWARHGRKGLQQRFPDVHLF
ncbi:3-beta hydroxysteroid dehydrogenase isomerase family [Mycena sanguinolenta]|uniref:3-beta hydroxysteroid dehydrogenase isomerase family n=1 Tax=Mycena sanguinolenta TaxID=230812 RepID=A0A8H6Y1A8_9AGAR|nr:3-beta hydroxysteroid dehydrogenase isomerase family [Mycena sanguinolenta]